MIGMASKQSKPVNGTCSDVRGSLATDCFHVALTKRPLSAGGSTRKNCPIIAGRVFADGSFRWCARAAPRAIIRIHAPGFIRMPLECCTGRWRRPSTKPFWINRLSSGGAPRSAGAAQKCWRMKKERKNTALLITSVSYPHAAAAVSIDGTRRLLSESNFQED